MTQLQFSLDMDILKESVINSNIDTVIKLADVLVLSEFMEKERDDYLHVAAYERSNEHRDYRNGYYERELTMSIGKINLKVPRTLILCQDCRHRISTVLSLGGLAQKV